MPTFVGTLSYSDLGAGVWLLRTDDGQQLQLQGAIPEGLDGQRVEVKGREVEAFGFGMAGPTLDVASVRRR